MRLSYFCKSDFWVIFHNKLRNYFIRCKYTSK